MSTETFSIFILKNSAQSLRQAETYLRNRKWQVGSGVNMREALAYIIQKHPQYILIAADHTNKKVKVLPRLLAQAFPIRIVAFSESSAPSAMQALREMGQAYTLFPPLSGPAIERMILKIKKDEETEAENRKHMGLSPEGAGFPGEDNKAIHLKGDGASGDQASRNFEQARAALSQLINSKDDDDLGMAYMPDHNSSPQQGQGSNFIPTGEPSKKATPQFTQEGPAEGESFEQWQERMKKTLAFKNQTQGPISEEKSATSSGPKADLKEAKTGGTGEHTSDWEGHDSKGGPTPYSAPKSDRPQSKSAPVMESDYVARKAKKNALYIRGNESSDPSRESLVVKGSVDALEQSVKFNENISDDDIQRIESATNVACIIIDSPRFSGYLVAALGKNRKIDNAFTEMIKQRLYAFLKANGEQIANENSMSMKIQEVPFEAWAIEEAEFLKRSVHDGNEIAMAFFPHDQVKAQFEASASDKMVKMSVEELRSDIALEFDLYMFLPENNKYLLYTPQGMPFYGNQKGRLTSKGVTHMHLRKESIGDVKKYRAQNFLNDKIESYKQAKKLKQGVN